MLTPAPWHPMDHNTVIPRPWPCLLLIPHCYDSAVPLFLSAVIGSFDASFSLEVDPLPLHCDTQQVSAFSPRWNPGFSLPSCPQSSTFTNYCLSFSF